MLEPFQLFEALHVGIGGGQVRLGLLVAAALGIGFLLRNRVGLAQRLITVCVDFRQVHRGDHLLPRGARLHQLLIDLRGVDVSQQFSLVHAAANVVIPAQQVAIGAGVDGRFDVRLQRAGQHQLFVGLLQGGMDDRDGRNGVLHRLFRQHVAVVNAGEHADQSAYGSASSTRAINNSALRGVAGGSSGGG